MDENNIQFDMNALLLNFQNVALNKVLANFADTPQERQTILNTLRSFNKYGVSTETALKIVNELKDSTPKGDDEE